MNFSLKEQIEALDPQAVLPRNRGLFYAGRWIEASGERAGLYSPSTGQSLGDMAVATDGEVDACYIAAQRGFSEWRAVAPFERGRILREAATILRANAIELAMIDAVDCGNPVREMTKDAAIAAAGLDYFAGLVQETKGETIPMGEGNLNFTLREPLGVCLRIIPYNHPLMFAAMRAGAPLAAGNALIVKPPHQAPLSSLRLAELWEGLFPAGVFNVITGDGRTGNALVTHPAVAKVALIGSVPTGRAVMKAAADRITPVGLELGGKNALIAYPDVAPEVVAKAAFQGMNFTWCGQSCGSTSRVFIHDDIYEETLVALKALCEATHPGLPTRYETDMGALVSREHFQRVLGYIETAKQEGGRLLTGGETVQTAELAAGFFIRPTIFADVTPEMTIAREEIFGPVAAVFRWREESDLFPQVNGVEYGLTASVWTNDLNVAMRAVQRIEAGYIWVNNTSQHFLGAPFGGYKQSGIGREESLDELLDYTKVKNVNFKLQPG